MSTYRRISKRIFDLFMAVLFTPLVLVLFLFTLVAMMIFEKRPYFYAAERMKTPTRAFRLWKFRTMTVVAGDSGISGGAQGATDHATRPDHAPDPCR